MVTLRRRLDAALHVLMGRPLIYRVEFHVPAGGPALDVIDGGAGLMVCECDFIGVPPVSPVTYKIVRFFEDDRDSEVVKTGLTFGEAREHCRRPDTRGEVEGVRWFDGYEQQ